MLAHPHTLQLRRWRLLGLLRELKEEGLEGLEVYYPSHDPDLIRQLLKMTSSLNLVATGGSDYHGQFSEHGSTLGSGPVEQLDLDVVRQLQDRCG